MQPQFPYFLVSSSLGPQPTCPRGTFSQCNLSNLPAAFPDLSTFLPNDIARALLRLEQCMETIRMHLTKDPQIPRQESFAGWFPIVHRGGILIKLRDEIRGHGSDNTRHSTRIIGIFRFFRYHPSGDMRCCGCRHNLILVHFSR